MRGGTVIVGNLPAHWSAVLDRLPVVIDADLYDVNLNPKPQYTALQQTLSLAPGAPHRVGPNRDDD